MGQGRANVAYTVINDGVAETRYMCVRCETCGDLRELSETHADGKCRKALGDVLAAEAKAARAASRDASKERALRLFKEAVLALVEAYGVGQLPLVFGGDPTDDDGPAGRIALWIRVWDERRFMAALKRWAGD